MRQLLNLNNQRQQFGDRQNRKEGNGFIHTGGETPVTFEPNCDADNGRQVDEAKAKAGADADSEDEREYVAGEGGDRHASRGQQRAGYGHRPAAPAVHKRTRYRTWKAVDNHFFYVIHVTAYVIYKSRLTSNYIWRQNYVMKNIYFRVVN